ncbi:hypothetical protein QPR60_11860 [Enterobacter hormaechei]|uniref:Uncharacterized protein n=1 Tax=Enterobacter hormaechei TaxID=158836 RepID=A0AAX3YWJ0_9ENTR|nr:type VI secretion system baseplate subunit TssF [Enterobacter hormaechei]EGK60420.1 hypothetical protein HMPREF9086_2526 [Enterobacter hormaechei ATCC 49162]EGQ5283854.1 hypothetical protein [Enterobacter hormaechei]MBT1821540.1 hypothetical protein [Enterobacter hormaechei]OIR52325.1 hypothetical protein BH712_01720 [Enterobacter hormaechei ATCC 49162]WMB09314.1 hypothetical protein QPR60_11860 [Enterobacter hormaechei]
MDDLTLRYYDAEMRYFLEVREEFAQAHPEQAESSMRPDVIKSQLQQKMDQLLADLIVLDPASSAVLCG